MKKYTVIYDIKANNTLWTEGRYVEAESPAEAKRIVKAQVKVEKGRHTFDLVAKAYEDGLTWQALNREVIINRNVNAMKESEKHLNEYGGEFWTESLERNRKRIAKSIEDTIAAGMTVTNYKNGRYCVRQH